jgi:hypothetical protein
MFSEIQLAQSASAAGTIQRQINHCCADRARFPQHRAPREGARAVVGSAKDIADRLEQRVVERAPATDSSSRRPTFPAHLNISSAW